MYRAIPAVIFGLFMAWVITQANFGNDSHLFAIVGWVPGSDKIGHVTLFFLLSTLTITAFNFRTLKIMSNHWPLGAALVFVVAVV